jgi:hypothetical protein
MSKSKSPSLKPGNARRSPASTGSSAAWLKARSHARCALRPPPSARYHCTSADRRPLAAGVPIGDQFDDTGCDETGPRAVLTDRKSAGRRDRVLGSDLGMTRRQGRVGECFARRQGDKKTPGQAAGAGIRCQGDGVRGWAVCREGGGVLESVATQVEEPNDANHHPPGFCRQVAAGHAARASIVPRALYRPVPADRPSYAG